jgi:hypothetical protein
MDINKLVPWTGLREKMTSRELLSLANVVNRKGIS